MAPTSSSLFPRQGFGGDGNGPGDFGDHRDRPGKGVSTWAILGIVIAIAVIALIVAFIIFRRIQRRRRMGRTANTPAINLQPPSSTTSSDPSKYSASSYNGGYTATADQNQSLLGNAEAPAIVMWDPSASEHHAGSTQDGFGYDNNLNLVQRPASVASFSAPPPRYEEATGSNAVGGLRPQGEAASYYNPPAQERGRSLTREGPSENSGRPRALSVDQRSVNGDRRRSFSRFREEGMVDVNVGVDAKS